MLAVAGGLYIQESVERWLVVQWAGSRLGGFGRWLVVGVWWWWQQWFLEGCELWSWRWRIFLKWCLAQLAGP